MKNRLNSNNYSNRVPAATKPHSHNYALLRLPFVRRLIKLSKYSLKKTELAKENGFVLIIGMMVVLALLSIAMTGGQLSIFEIKFLDTYKLLKQGYYMTEGGHSLVLSQVALSPGIVPASNYSLNQSFFQTNLFEYPQGNNSSTDPGTFGLEYYSGARGGFSTVFSNPVTTNRVPGFSAENFIFTRYEMVTRGWYKKGDATLGAKFEKRGTATIGSVIYLYTGTVHNP